MSKTIKTWSKRILIALIGIIVVAMVGMGIYVSDYYRADPQFVDVAMESSETVTVVEQKNKQIAFVPEHPVAGFIFYPGGKVEYKAYAPLLRECAEQGILTIVVHMPANLAVLDVNAADGIQSQYPEVTKWYIGGHSLGGAMSAAYASKHTTEFDGLILLGAYSTKDISQSGMRVLSMYGSNDEVMKKDSYEAYKQNLPTDYKEVVIEGGCHAYFGSYGAQKGDGTPTISNQEQIQITADEILSFIKQ